MTATFLLSSRGILKIALPPLLATLLFVVTIFALALPTFKRDLLEEQKLHLSSVTTIVSNTLAYYQRQAESGELSLATAQSQALAQVRQLRYGRDGKDYFWINDLAPRMLMHPYRPELEGTDLTPIADSDGKHIFREIAELLRQEESGFIQYNWQWNDEPNHLGAKLSRVQLFRPWGWIIGTGIHLDEMESEISRIIWRLIHTSLFILAIILGLSTLMIRNHARETRRRLTAEGELSRYRDNLEELVEKRSAELKDAMSNIKVLSGFLPICAACKKIRDDKGYWNQIESYIRDHSEAQFSHSICPDCAKQLYPELDLSNRTPRKE